MRVTYAISADDYRTLRPAFKLQAGRNAGFKIAVAVCALVSLAGVFLATQNAGWLLSCFFVAFGALAATAVYFLDRRSVREAKQKYEREIAHAYQKIHCRDHREFAADENGFTESCKCGTITRPWREAVRLAENEKFFFLSTRAGWLQALPKSAFTTVAEVTEFRQLAQEKAEVARPATSPQIEFAYKRADFRSAYWLDVRCAGRWRGILSSTLVAAGMGWALLVVFQHQSGGRHDPVLPYIAFGSAVAAMLEDTRSFLLYRTPNNYVVFPKRVLVGRAVEFLTCAKNRVAPYNRRNPTTVESASQPKTSPDRTG